MGWLRVESSFAQHRKIMNAAEQLGPGSIARVIGVWTLGACHAVTHLTDGFVPRFVLENSAYDRKVKVVVDAMVGAGLIRTVEGGYQYHDFNHYNPSAEAVLAKRTADLARKNRSGKAVEVTHNPQLFQNDSKALARTPARARPNPNPKDQDPSLRVSPSGLNPNPLDKDQNQPAEIAGPRTSKAAR